MDKLYRRFFKSLIILLGCMLLLAACGPKEEAVQPSPSGDEGKSFLSDGGGENLDVAMEDNAFYDVASDLKGPYDESTSDDGKFLGMQFYQGEPVQLWASAPYSESGGNYVSVYMYRQDGTRETCLERIERAVGINIVFRDSEGYCYNISRGSEKDSVVKRDSAGKALSTVRIEGHVWKVCELADGRLAMLVYEGNSVNNLDIVLLDEDGKLTTVAISEQLPGETCIGASEDGLLLIKNDCLYRVVLPEGKLEQVFSFGQTSFSLKKNSQEMRAFCVRGDGKLGLLWSDRQGSGLCETFSLVERDQDKKEVVLRGLTANNQYWIKEQILKFNSSNDRYRVVIECPEEWSENDAFITRTTVELTAGKGPDILMNDLIELPASLIEKGRLVDLAPLMEQAGMKEDDYFPVAFDTWRTGGSIYSITCSSAFSERLMLSAVLGDNAPERGYPDIEMVVDALLAYPENAVYDGYSSADEILSELLGGSETLWGMVDWEKGICDFGGELFGKLLEAAKRYQYDARNNYPAICSERTFCNVRHFYTFPTLEETRAGGNVPVGVLSDDGGHPVSMFSDSLSINANGANREGAWEFLQFLLSEEVQGSMTEAGVSIYMPVKKSVFRAMAEEEILNGPTKKYNTDEGTPIESSLPRERAEEIEALVGEIRALPFNTEAILEIVLKEAQDYFDGVKEIPQVVSVIENRVGLYLEERK